MVCAGDQGEQGGDHADWAMSRKEGEQDSTVYFLGRRPYIGEGCTECLHNITQGTLTQQDPISSGGGSWRLLEGWRRVQCTVHSAGCSAQYLIPGMTRCQL